MQTLEEIIEKHSKEYPEIIYLFEWSQNYEYPSPMSYFLDLIGYSNNEYDDTLGDWSKVTEKIAHLELVYISEALNEYLENPDGAYAFIQKLIGLEV